jgi:hypothetical protein
MFKAHLGVSALAVFACIALAGCSSGTVVPPSYTNISGDYTGTVQDAQGGSGTATATFAQHGSSVGGAITIAQASATVVAQTTLTISTTNSVSGAMVIDYASGTQCTFSTSGTYDPNSNVLSGTYTAVTNCTGDTGSYSLTQKCSATATSAADRRALGLPSLC